MNPVLSSDTYRKFQDYIRLYLGLYFPEHNKYLLENGLRRRVAAVPCDSFEDYYHYLQFDSNRQQEYAELVNCLTTNETFFFRDQAQIDCLRLHLIPEIITRRKHQQTLRIWSAGCSSGEEPYTLAIMFAEYFPELVNWDIEIIGTDLNEEVLAKARKGRYDDYAIRNITPRLLKKYFWLSDGHYEVQTSLQKRVKFLGLNLFDPSQIRVMQDIDLVLCRNVLIYFDEQGRQQIVSGFYNVLRKNSALMIGFSEVLHHSESLFCPSPWERTMVYYKKNN